MLMRARIGLHCAMCRKLDRLLAVRRELVTLTSYLHALRHDMPHADVNIEYDT